MLLQDTLLCLCSSTCITQGSISAGLSTLGVRPTGEPRSPTFSSLGTSMQPDAPWNLTPHPPHHPASFDKRGWRCPSPLVWGHQVPPSIWGRPCRVRAGDVCSVPVATPIGLAGFGQGWPRRAEPQPSQGALRKEHVFSPAGFPLAAPPAHSLPRAPLRGRPALHTPRLPGPADL